eukprot:Platyproteum_vivax@DN6428_c0_g1_i2.p1
MEHRYFADLLKQDKTDPNDLKQSELNIEKRSREKDLEATPDFEKRLRHNFEQVYSQNNSWAKADSQTETDATLFGLLQTSELLVRGSKRAAYISENELNVTQLPNLQNRYRGFYATNVVQFNPKLQIAMVGNADKVLKIFRVDSEGDHLMTKVASYMLKKFAISKGLWTSDGLDALLIAKNATSIMEYDLESDVINKIQKLTKNSPPDEVYSNMSMGPESLTFGGNGPASLFAVSASNGSTLICSQKSKQLVQIVRNNAATTASAFHRSQPLLYTSDTEGYIYEWDLRTCRCARKFTDSSMLGITCLEMSQNLLSEGTDYCLASGSSCGVVDLYKIPHTSNSSPIAPYKSVLNLTTAVDSLAFHHSTQLLGLGSGLSQKSFRLLNLNTNNVIKNWPKEKDNIRKTTAVSFSRHGGYLALGEESGGVNLFQLDKLKDN